MLLPVEYHTILIFQLHACVVLSNDFLSPPHQHQRTRIVHRRYPKSTNNIYQVSDPASWVVADRA
jgi:hypothetical protein